MGKLRILVAEDAYDMKLMIKTFIGEKYDLIMADNGQQAYELAISESPDIIITDVRMPKMNGLDLCLKLREDEKFKDTPIIMMTGINLRDELPDNFWKKGSGADEFITKPFEPAELMERIENVIKRKILKIDEKKSYGKAGYM